MKHHFRKTGFTIIEIALFLALSGFLMVGIIVGANISISRQRYNDTVNDFAEFIRGVYTDVLNVSNDKNPEESTEEAGRTKTAVYGKLISIGECADTSCSTLDDTIYVYDIVGLARSSASVRGERAIQMLYNGFGSGGVEAGIVDTSGCSTVVGCQKFYRKNEYHVSWDGIIQVKNGISGTTNGSRFRGAILVVRSPSTGSIRTYTFSYGNSHDVVYLFHNYETFSNAKTNFTKFLKEKVDASTNHGQNELTVCIESDDNVGANRRGLKIDARASNSSGVMLTEMDQDNSCLGRPNI